MGSDGFAKKKKRPCAQPERMSKNLASFSYDVAHFSARKPRSNDHHQAMMVLRRDEWMAFVFDGLRDRSIGELAQTAVKRIVDMMPHECLQVRKLSNNP